MHDGITSKVDVLSCLASTPSQQQHAELARQCGSNSNSAVVANEVCKSTLIGATVPSAMFAGRMHCISYQFECNPVCVQPMAVRLVHALHARW